METSAAPAFDPTFLEYWLKTATHGLCAEACAFIRAEIEPRYARLYEESRISGQSGEQAAAQAFRTLGDPEAARSRFARTHLWEFEAMMVSRFTDHPTRRARIWELIELLLPMPLLWFAWLQRDTPGKWTLLAFWAFLTLLKILVSMRIFIARHLKRTTRMFPDFLNFFYYTGLVCSPISLGQGESRTSEWPSFMPVILMATVGILILFIYSRLWLKLRGRVSV